MWQNEQGAGHADVCGRTSTGTSCPSLSTSTTCRGLYGKFFGGKGEVVFHYIPGF